MIGIGLGIRVVKSILWRYKVIIIFFVILISNQYIYSQNNFRYIINANGGLRISNNGTEIDSIKEESNIFKIYTQNNSYQLDTTGNTKWNDLMFPVQTLKSIGNTDKPDYDKINQTLDFPEDTTEAIGFVVQMPHSWKEGSTIYPHVHWLRSTADGVDWRFRYKWFNIGAALPGTWTEKILSHNTQTRTTGTIHELSRSVNGVGLSGAGKTISSILVVKFYRRSDNYTGDAKLLQIDIHYEQDALGSGHETYK